MLKLRLLALDADSLEILRRYLQEYDSPHYLRGRISRLESGRTVQIKIPDGQAALKLWEVVRKHGSKDQIRQLREFILSQGGKIPPSLITADSPLEELGFDMAITNILLRRGIRTAGDLKLCTDDDLYVHLGRGKRLRLVKKRRDELNFTDGA